MGLLDKAKKLAGKNPDKVGQTVDKAAEAADRKTGGKYAEQIDKGAGAATGFVAGDGENVAVGEEGEQEPPSRLAP